MPSRLSKYVMVAALLLAGCAFQKPMPQQQVAYTINPAPPLVSQNAIPPVKGEIPPAAPTLKVALLLPLSGDSVAIGNAMLDAATMALSDAYFTAPTGRIHTQVILLPKDTGVTAAKTKAGLQEAIDQGATVVIGPLFSTSVTAVAELAKAHHMPVISFSNNAAVADKDIYTFGFMPEQQVTRMAEYAYLHNYQRVAVLAPNDAYGSKIKDALSAAYTQKGGTVMPAELYASSAINIDAAVSRIAAAYNNAKDDRRFQAIFVADSGSQMKNIIASLKKNNIDLTKIKLLGTGLWDDPEIPAIPDMAGAWFPSSPSEPYGIFEKRFMSTYNYKPIRLASLAYDAVTLVANLAMPTAGTGIDAAMLTDSQGFVGPANGLYRLNENGTSDRKLAVMEVTSGGVKVIDPAKNHF